MAPDLEGMRYRGPVLSGFLLHHSRDGVSKVEIHMMRPEGWWVGDLFGLGSVPPSHSFTLQPLGCKHWVDGRAGPALGTQWQWPPGKSC